VDQIAQLSSQARVVFSAAVPYTAIGHEDGRNQFTMSKRRDWQWGLRSRDGIRLCLVLALVIGFHWETVGCSPIPRRYLLQAETGVTLMDLQRAPQQYQGKTVILGGVIVHEEKKDGRLWLRMMNRPLDQNQRPHLSGDSDGPEAGYYWVALDAEKIPEDYHDWAQVTVVGQVVPTKPGVKSDPILAAVYLRGWSRLSNQHGIWEVDDPNYTMDAPAGLHGE
jgi:outer membrane lipoprotein Slp family protein